MVSLSIGNQVVLVDLTILRVQASTICPAQCFNVVAAVGAMLKSQEAAWEVF